MLKVLQCRIVLDTPMPNKDPQARLKCSYRKAIASDDESIAEHFYNIWLDNGLTPENLLPNAKIEVLSFIQNAREQHSYQAFVAEVDQTIVGSAGSQLFGGLYPMLFQPSYRKIGYIWGVYVEPDYRHQGIGRSLTQMNLDYLQTIGCTRAILHASPLGRPVYEQLGFQPNNEMLIELQ
jgi:GNAT superfamily N-acetyltransferase